MIVLTGVGLITLAIGSAMSFVDPSHWIVWLLGNALIIGGWVFIWEAVSLFTFGNRELRERLRLLTRIHDAPILFRAREDG